MIHALGAQRREFLTRLDGNPDAVVTSAPELGPWVGWSLSANWWFYSGLLRDFVPVVSSPSTVVWRPADTPTTWVETSCSVDASGGTVSFEVERGGLYEVQVAYVGPGSFARGYTMIRNNLNRAADADGYLALNPGVTTQSFPVYESRAGMSRLDTFDVGGSPDIRLTTLTSCEARALAHDERSQAVYDIYAGLFPASTR